MTLKSLTIATLLLLSAEAPARQWMIIPKGTHSQKSGINAMAAVQGLSGRIEKLDVYKTADSETAPEAPLGYSVEEVKQVKVLSNDPLYAQQWNLARVMASRGWAMMPATGMDVMVAVVDTGIDASHPDLAGKVAGGANFVDNGSGAPLPSGSWFDDNAHGTFCASLVTAARDNGVGMAGVGRAKLLAVKVLDSHGYGTDYGVAQGMVWAVDQGAKILSISLGTGVASNVLTAAAQYAKDHGVLVIAASGNGGTEQMVYPAALAGVLSVGASTRSDTRAAYSTYNSQLAMVAPGGDDSAQILGAVPGGGYSQGAGTSFACPQVAGAAALYLALHPGASAEACFAALTATADPIDMAAGRSLTTGWGRLNVARLLGEDVEPNVFAVQKMNMVLPPAGTVLTALVGAGEPKAPVLSNPDPSHVGKVWMVVSQDGTELVREELASMGGNDWTAQVTVPTWAGSASRVLALSYQAEDSTGHTTALVDAGSLVQAAGSVAPTLSHTAPPSAETGKPLALVVTVSGGTTALSAWTLHAKASDGSWNTLAGDCSVAGQVTFNVPAAWMNTARFEYYFSAVDAGGRTITLKSAASPYAFEVYALEVPMKLAYMANPAPELCLRLIAGKQGLATVEFFNVAGENVGTVNLEVRQGENLVCLGKTVASGTYIGLARMQGERGMSKLKMAVKL